MTWTFLIADRHLARDRAAELDARAPLRDEEPDQLAGRDERDGEAVLRPPRASSGPSSARPSVWRALPGSGSLAFRSSSSRAGSSRYTWQARAPSSGRASGGDRLQELVERVRTRDRLRELGELLELGDAEPRLLVEARVLDRARDERRRGHDEVDLVVGELPRGLGVRGDRADRLARAADDRHGEQRLVALLLELRHVLHPRIGERVLADERRLAVLCGPPREALAPLERDLPDLALVRRRRRAHDEPRVVLDEVDEAAVDAARVRHEPHDGRQHLGELDRRGDGRDDLLEELLARLQGHRASIV